MYRTLLGGVVTWLLAASFVSAQEPFSKLVGSVAVAPVKTTTPLEIPYITWGGDVATFHANGGLTTKSGSIYDKLALNIKLTVKRTMSTRNSTGSISPL